MLIFLKKIIFRICRDKIRLNSKQLPDLYFHKARTVATKKTSSQFFMQHKKVTIR